MKLNTAYFWNQKITNSSVILNSPIYIHKNLIILSKLIFKSGNYLDIGFGYGVIQRFLSILNKKINLYGIDISKVAVDRINSKTNGQFVVSNINNIPFKNVKFDLISALDILEHLDIVTFNKSLNLIYSRLKKGGIFYLSLPINESYKDTMLNHHLQKINVIETKNKLLKVGFKIEKVYFLTAYSKFYLLKSAINLFLKISKPNLVILICRKK